MKKIILSVMALVIAIVIFTGCVDISPPGTHTAIQGTIHNRTDNKIYLKTVHRSLGETNYYIVTNTTYTTATMKIGTLDLSARLYDTEDYFATGEIVIEATDTTFTIIVYNTTIYASATS